ncbi:MAG: SDR family NAD(P)-dependent oxidoreductase, partial [Burkholderiales bacterium]
MTLQISLAGRTVLITGGGRGIGRAIALQCARAGADVAINYKRDAAAAQQTVADIEALGRRGVAYEAAVDQREQAEGLADAVL